MRIIYKGPFDAVDIPTLNNLVCPRGEPVDVPANIAKGLLAQGSTTDADGKPVPAEHPTWVKAKTSNKKGGE